MPEVVIEELELNCIFLQYFYNRGQYDTYLSLEKETGINLVTYQQEVGFQRGQILEGKFDQAETYLNCLRGSLDVNVQLIQFELRKQEYFELLHKKSSDPTTLDAILKLLNDIEVLTTPENYECQCNQLAQKNFSNDPLQNKWTQLSGRLKCFEKIYKEVHNIFEPHTNNNINDYYESFLKMVTKQGVNLQSNKGLFYYPGNNQEQVKYSFLEDSILGNTGNLQPATIIKGKNQLLTSSGIQTLNDQVFKEKNPVGYMNKPYNKENFDQNLNASHKQISNNELRSSNNYSQTLRSYNSNNEDYSKSRQMDNYLINKDEFREFYHNRAKSNDDNVQNCGLARSSNILLKNDDTKVEMASLNSANTDNAEKHIIYNKEVDMETKNQSNEFQSENIRNVGKHNLPGNRIKISKVLQENNIKTSQNEPVFSVITSKDKERNVFQENSQEKIETNEEKTVVIENLYLSENCGMNTNRSNQNNEDNIMIQNQQLPAVKNSITEEEDLHKYENFKQIFCFQDSLPIRCTAFSPNGDFFSVGSNTGSLRVFCLSTILKNKKYEGLNTLDRSQAALKAEILDYSKKSIYTLDYSENGKFIASGGLDLSVRVISIQNDEDNKIAYDNRETVVMNGHEGVVRSICMRPSNNFVYSGGHDPYICMWDVNKAKCANKLVSKDNFDVFSLQSTYENDILVSAGSEGFARIWDTRNQKEQFRLGNGSYGPMNYVSLAYTSQNNNFSSLLKYSRLANRTCLLSDNKYSVLIAHKNGHITNWDLRKPNKVVKSWNFHEQECRSVEYDPSLNYFVSSSFDDTSIIYDINKDKIIQRIKIHDDKVVQARWHPFLPIIVTTSADQTVRVMASESYLNSYN